MSKPRPRAAKNAFAGRKIFERNDQSIHRLIFENCKIQHRQQQQQIQVPISIQTQFFNERFLFYTFYFQRRILLCVLQVYIISNTCKIPSFDFCSLSSCLRFFFAISRRSQFLSQNLLNIQRNAIPGIFGALQACKKCILIK